MWAPHRIHNSAPCDDVFIVITFLIKTGPIGTPCVRNLGHLHWCAATHSTETLSQLCLWREQSRPRDATQHWKFLIYKQPRGMTIATLHQPQQPSGTLQPEASHRCWRLYVCPAFWAVQGLPLCIWKTPEGLRKAWKVGPYTCKLFPGRHFLWGPYIRIWKYVFFR